MKSFTALRNLFGTLSQDSSTANLTLGDELINDGLRKILTMPQDWDFDETSTTGTTVASQQFYNIAFNYHKLRNVTITVGTTIHTMEEVASREEWDFLNEAPFSSDIPEKFHIFEDQIGFWPTPSSSANVITFYYKERIKDLSIADFTTGTVTVTNGDATVTIAGGGTFTAAMAGRWLQTTNDKFWYRIATFTDANNVELTFTFDGLTEAGATFVIGEMSILPEEHQELPLWYALMIYFARNDTTKFNLYKGMWETGLKSLENDRGNKTTSPSAVALETIENPNLFIRI